MHTKYKSIALYVTLSVAACSTDPNLGHDTDTIFVEESVETTSTPDVAPVPDTLPAVVARINGLDVTNEELERAIRAAETKAGQVVPPQFRDQVYRRVLDRLIDFHLLLQESHTRYIVVDSAEIDDELTRIEDSYPTVEAFEQQLRDWNSSIDALREETRKDLLVAKTIGMELTTAIGVDDAALQAFYDQHPDQFTGTETIHASHILIGTTPDADMESRDAARKVATDLREKAITAGTNFAELARQHSTDESTAANGGDLGFIKRGQTVPQFEAALFELEPGKISEVVESPLGFHIVQAGERRDAELIPYEQARPQIRTMFVEQQRQLLMTGFLSRLRESATVEILI